MKKIILIIIFFFYSNISLSDNLVYLDVQYLIDNSNLGKFYKKDIKIIQDKNTLELKKKEKEITDLEIEIDSKKNVLSEVEIGKKIKKLNILVKDYQILRNKFNGQIVKEKKKYTKNILNIINPILTDYVKTNDIQLVLDKKNVLIGIKTLDITDIILKKLDVDSKTKSLINEN